MVDLPRDSFLRGGSILLPTARAPLPADGPSQLVSANRVAQAAASLRVVRLVRLLRLLRTPGCCVGEAAAPFGATSGADLVDAMVDQVAPFFLFGGGLPGVSVPSRCGRSERSGRRCWFVSVF